jgi:hypothetical protein
MTLNSIPWKAAFVGVPGNFPIIYIPATLVLINLYAGKLLASSVCIIEQKSCNEHKVPTPEYDKNRTKTCFLLFSAVKVEDTTLFIIFRDTVQPLNSHFRFLEACWSVPSTGSI